MTITDPQGLYQDICFHPDDMSLRLIFADWCEDNNDPLRAEFIRKSVELYQLEEKIKLEYGFLPSLNSATNSFSLQTDMQRYKLIHQCNHLLHQAEGTRIEIPGWMSPTSHVAGFVGVIFPTLTDWIEYGVEAVKNYPIMEVWFTSGRMIEPLRCVRVAFYESPSATSRLFYSGPYIKAIAYFFEEMPKKDYKDQKDALKHLGEYCVQWARRKAGIS